MGNVIVKSFTRDLTLLAYFDRTLYVEIKRLTGYYIDVNF